MTKRKRKHGYVVVFNTGTHTCVLAVEGSDLNEAFEDYKVKTEEAFGMTPAPVFFGAGKLGDNLTENFYPKYLVPEKVN